MENTNLTPSQIKARKIATSPCASYWLRQAIKDLMKRDCVDACDDAKTLSDLMDMRMNEAFFSVGK